MLRMVLLATLVAAAPACAPEGPENDPVAGDGSAVSAVDDAGRTVQLPRPATRIVSLLPSATETLAALGAAELLVARTDYDYVDGVAGLPSVGGGLTASVEAIAAVRPDLVIAWEEAGGTRIRPRLEELGIPVFAVQTRDTAGVFDTIDRLGTLTGRTEAAVALADRLRAELEGVRRSVAHRDTPSVLYLISRDPPMVAASGLFITEVIEVAGGRTAFPDLRHSPQVSLEEILRRRPNVVLVPVGADSARAIRRLTESTGWRELLAVEGVRVHTVPADVLHRAGPSIGEAARILRSAIHPDTRAAAER